jgi:hypothetical protein
MRGNNEFEKVWKEEVVALLKVPTMQVYAWRNRGKPQKPTVRIVLPDGTHPEYKSEALFFGIT